MTARRILAGLGHVLGAGAFACLVWGWFAGGPLLLCVLDGNLCP